MTTGDPKGFRFRESTRAPYKTKVQLRYEKDGEQTSGLSANVSMEGVFVETNEPRPVGTLVQFEFDLDGQNIQGLGDVVWIRTRPLGAEKPAGMGVQFRYIDPQSRDLVFQIVDQYLKDSKDGDAIPAPGSGMPTGGAIGAPPVGSGSFQIPTSPAPPQQPPIPSTPAAPPTAPMAPPVQAPPGPPPAQPTAHQPLPQETVQLDPRQLAHLAESVSPPSLDPDLELDLGAPPPRVPPEPPPVVNPPLPNFDLASDPEDFGFASEPASTPAAPTAVPPALDAIDAIDEGFDAGPSLLGSPDSTRPLPEAPQWGFDQAGVRPLEDPDTLPGGTASSPLSNFDINEATAEPVLPPPEQEPPPFFDPEPSYYEQQISQTEPSGSQLRRLLPFIVLVAVLTTVAWFLKDRILSLVGMGGSEVPEIVAQAPPPIEEPSVESVDSQPVAQDPIDELEDYDEDFAEEYEDSSIDGEAGDDFLDPEPEDLTEDFESDPEPEQAQIPPPVREQPRASQPEPRATSAPAPVPTSQPGARIERIATATSGAGTVVTIDASANLTEASVSQLRLEAPPRLLVRVRGISEPHNVSSLRAPEFSAVRAGLHNTAERGREIHLVFDLTDPNIQADSSVEGGNLVLRFRQN